MVRTTRVKQLVLTAALAAIAALAADPSAGITLDSASAIEAQGWKVSGGQAVTLSEDTIIIEDESAEDTATLSHPIASDLAAEIAKNGFELSFTTRISDASPSGMGLEIHVAKAVRLPVALSSFQNKQNISFHDAVINKHMGNAIKTDDFVNYRIVWKPGADGGEVSVFANDQEVISKGHAGGPQNWPSSIKIGGNNAGNPRVGKLQIKNLQLKALEAE